MPDQRPPWHLPAVAPGGYRPDAPQPGTYPSGVPPPYAPAGAPLGPPTNPKRGRWWILAALAGVAVLLCLGIVWLFGGSGETRGGTGEIEPTPGAPEAGKIGEPVRDGSFEFTVTKVRCGAEQVGDPYLAAQAQGQFCLVSLSVKNVRDEAKLFTDEDQKARGPDGKEYAVDSEAALVANENADGFFTEINPGNTLDGVLVFDIPSDARLTSVELHDSAFSEGATVAV